MSSFSQATVARNNRIGSAVPVFPQPSGALLDPDYIDYGTPHYEAYASQGPPYIFMGVDFTAPFNPDWFPLEQLPYKRRTLLRRYLGTIKEPPHHLWVLSRQAHRAERKSAGSQRQREDQWVIHMLPSSLPTMTGDIVLYLFQAPLAFVHPPNYDESDPMCAHLIDPSDWLH